MISGYNTDVPHGGVVFHVQTEDKGIDNPWIESLIYVGGRVVASRRMSYAELLAARPDRDAIAQLVDRQHRGVIAAIHAGRLDHRLGVAPPPAPPASPPADRGAAPSASDPPAPPPAAAPVPTPGEEAAAERRTLDAIVLDYLERADAAERLLLAMEADGDLALGRQARVRLTATSSAGGAPVVGASVSVKLISTVQRPLILAAGRTGPDGRLDLTLDVPGLERGTAALIVAAASDRAEAEIKVLL